MGAGIVQTMAQKGLAVTMKGRSNESLDRAMPVSYTHLTLPTKA